MLLYSLLHLTGYALPLEDLKRFRQWESLTPGHPEYGHTPGVDATTGPLGQGLSNGVGMAMAEAHLAALYNRPGFEIIDHYTYGIVTDGDLMEGVASEAASLAGHLKLGKLIYLYDDNRISIEGSTDIAFTEDRGKRFEAYGWHVQRVGDGRDVEAIDAAIEAAKLDPRPSLIIVPNIIGYGLPTRQGTAKAHGEPPGRRGAERGQGQPGLAEGAALLPSGVGASALPPGGPERSRAGSCVAGEVRSVPCPIPRACRGAGAPAGRRPACGLGRGPAGVPGGRKRHRVPRIVRQGVERHSPQSCPSSSAARPTWRPRTTRG